MTTLRPVAPSGRRWSSGLSERQVHDGELDDYDADSGDVEEEEYDYNHK